MAPLIKDYRLSLSEPACTPGASKWGGLAEVTTDISPVFPFLNAVWERARYDHENKVLVYDREGQKFALRPHEIRVAWVQHIAHADEIVTALTAEINRIWENRREILPDTREREFPDVMTLFKLLPRSNCRDCGYASCLAYAVALRTGEAALEDCPTLPAPELEQLRELVS